MLNYNQNTIMLNYNQNTTDCQVKNKKTFDGKFFKNRKPHGEPLSTLNELNIYKNIFENDNNINFYGKLNSASKEFFKRHKKQAPSSSYIKNANSPIEKRSNFIFQEKGCFNKEYNNYYNFFKDKYDDYDAGQPHFITSANIIDKKNSKKLCFNLTINQIHNLDKKIPLDNHTKINYFKSASNYFETADGIQEITNKTIARLETLKQKKQDNLNENIKEIINDNYKNYLEENKFNIRMVIEEDILNNEIPTHYNNDEKNIIFSSRNFENPNAVLKINHYNDNEIINKINKKLHMFQIEKPNDNSYEVILKDDEETFYYYLDNNIIPETYNYYDEENNLNIKKHIILPTTNEIKKRNKIKKTIHKNYNETDIRTKTQTIKRATEHCKQIAQLEKYNKAIVINCGDQQFKSREFTEKFFYNFLKTQEKKKTLFNYFYVFEKTEKGNWHIHILLKKSNNPHFDDTLFKQDLTDFLHKNQIYFNDKFFCNITNKKNNQTNYDFSICSMKYLTNKFNDNYIKQKQNYFYINNDDLNNYNNEHITHNNINQKLPNKEFFKSYKNNFALAADNWASALMETMKAIELQNLITEQIKEKINIEYLGEIQNLKIDFNYNENNFKIKSINIYYEQQYTEKLQT